MLLPLVPVVRCSRRSGRRSSSLKAPWERDSSKAQSSAQEMGKAPKALAAGTLGTNASPDVRPLTPNPGVGGSWFESRFRNLRRGGNDAGSPMLVYISLLERLTLLSFQPLP